MTNTNTVLMVDTTHDAIQTHPVIVQKQAVVGGYDTGTPDIQWTAEDWKSIGTAVPVRIWQGFGAVPDFASFDEIDLEKGAVTVQQAAATVAARVKAGIPWTGIYASRANLDAVGVAIRAYGHDVWNGHVACRLADWNLNRAQATALVGTEVSGMTCYAVQWASPTSNPDTIMPGSSGLTLKQANVDLSVADEHWITTYLLQRPKPVPVPVPVPVKPTEVLVKYSDGSLRVLLTL